MRHGTVFWITGLAGAGKTTIGTALYKKLKQESTHTVLLDGDAMRAVFGNDLGYTTEDRFKCSMRYSRLCKLLSDQGIDVICCTVSMSEKVRKWNRDNIDNYMEIYVKVDDETLIMRNQKELYKNDAANVVGVSIEAQLPSNPHITIINCGSSEISNHVDIIINEWVKKPRNL